MISCGKKTPFTVIPELVVIFIFFGVQTAVVFEHKYETFLA